MKTRKPALAVTPARTPAPSVPSLPFREILETVARNVCALDWPQCKARLAAACRELAAWVRDSQPGMEFCGNVPLQTEIQLLAARLGFRSCPIEWSRNQRAESVVSVLHMALPYGGPEGRFVLGGYMRDGSGGEHRPLPKADREQVVFVLERWALAADSANREAFDSECRPEHFDGDPAEIQMVEEAMRCVTGALATVQAPRVDGEWSPPLSQAEIARRVTKKHNARPREIQQLLKRWNAEKLEGNKVRVRLDLMDAHTRKLLESA